ncbi:MAG: class I SAM-dependent methyltransferase [Deltaproteobacteria bacterium]|nr:class I SAM-dependent methyltransferase [Deltaproteobacteria bacterium]MBW1847971.1 class I SAM-dependent methyltransferase [Deltaproteobacteria bacterium]
MKNKNIIVVQSLIKQLDLKTLKRPAIVADLIRAFGIVQWGPPAFGNDEKFKNAFEDMAGIYQTPDQIAKALIYLSTFEINSYLEIGVFQGGNFIFVSEYLRRFNPKIKCTGIDPTNYLNPEIKEIIDSEDWLTFLPITSNEITTLKFDLVFIDGDHDNGWIKKDWENVGRNAKICMLHDIQEVSCPEIVEFWGKLKGEKVEFLDYSSELSSQGIGIIQGGKL